MPGMSMTPQRRVHVFFNVAFDDDTEWLYLSLILSIVGIGMHPRCVLDVPPDASRLQRLNALIRKCPFSVHDLSRVQLSNHGFRVPRFNMPFELGLAVAIAHKRRRRSAHRFRVFEQTPHRLAQSLSDLNGYDPFIHAGTPVGLYRAMRDAFVELESVPLASERQFKKAFRAMCVFRRQFFPGSVFRRHAFEELVGLARLVVAATADRESRHS